MTHINAYFQDVQEAEKNVIQAQAELEGAKARLEAKKNEEGFENTAPKEESTDSKQTVKVTATKSKSKK